MLIIVNIKKMSSLFFVLFFKRRER